LSAQQPPPPPVRAPGGTAAELGHHSAATAGPDRAQAAQAPSPVHVGHSRDQPAVRVDHVRGAGLGIVLPGMTGDDLSACQAGEGIGKTALVLIVLFIWALVDVILAVLFLVTRGRAGTAHDR
jgi:hypothetical protein